jgi:hypothetical protein
MRGKAYRAGETETGLWQTVVGAIGLPAVQPCWCFFLLQHAELILAIFACDGEKDGFRIPFRSKSNKTTKISMYEE